MFFSLLKYLIFSYTKDILHLILLDSGDSWDSSDDVMAELYAGLLSNWVSVSGRDKRILPKMSR
jgi:hypothetical protein